MTRWFRLRTYRPPDRAPDRHAANGLLLSAVAALALHIHRQPLWLSLGVCGMLAWRYLVENYSWRSPGRLLRWGLLIAALVAVINTYGTLLGREAGISLLALLVGLKILEIRSLRDYFVSVFLLYFLTLGAFLFSQSLITAALAMIVAVVTTAALVRLSLPNTFPASEGVRLTLAILWRAIPIMLLLYLLFPRIQGSLWGLPGDAFAARTGLSDTVVPGSFNALSSDDAVAFRVHFTGPAPPAHQLYWRSLVLSHTDGTAWSRSGADRIAVNTEAWRFRGDGPPVSYTVDYEATGHHWLVALDLPAMVPATAIAHPGFVLEAKKRVEQRIHYAMRSYPAHDISELTPAAREFHLRAPRPASARIQELVDEWRRGSDPVDAALRFFNEQDFHYTLSPPLLADDTLDAFMFGTRRGYCEHYATAFAMLMRHTGIPSRLVVGYQGGVWNDAGDYLVVRQTDAHAWTEVWRDGRGWIRVDPTAAVAPERIELGMTALQALLAQGALPGELEAATIRALLEGRWLARQWSRLGMYWDAANTAWNRWVMAYGPARQLRLLQSLGFETPSWLQVATTLFIGIGALLLVLAATLLTKRDKPDPVAASYRRFCAKLGRSGLARHAHEGPMDFYQRISAARPELAPDCKRIIGLYIMLRYGGVTRPDFVDQLRWRVRHFTAAGHRAARTAPP